MRFVMALMSGLVLSSVGWGQSLAKAKADFAVQDKKLNAVYGELKKTLAEHLFEKVKSDQRDWVEHRDYIAEWESKAQQKKPAEDPAYWKTATWLTEERVKFLSAWKGIGEAGQWTGVYRDGYGGELRIVERGGKLHFALNVVRGPTHHTGTIGGAAKVNGGTAWFATKGDGEKEETWLTILNNSERDGRIEVIGENTQHFHGARAYFEGRYLRVSLLSAKAAEKVVAEAAKGGISE